LMVRALGQRSHATEPMPRSHVSYEIEVRRPEAKHMTSLLLCRRSRKKEVKEGK
jgi:hypothetical protein